MRPRLSPWLLTSVQLCVNQYLGERLDELAYIVPVSQSVPPYDVPIDPDVLLWGWIKATYGTPDIVRD